jgi:hypothetical protein
VAGAQTAFVLDNLPYAESVSAQTGLPVDYVLAQSAEETGFGTSSAATLLNNFFGLSPGGSLASYGSPQAGFDAYASLMQSPGYAGVLSAAGSGPDAIGSALVSAGYNTADPAYSSKVGGLVSTIDQILGDTGNASLATGGVGSPSVPGGTAAQSGTQTGAGSAVAGNCGLSPGCWFGYLGSLAVRASFVLLAVIFLLGAVYIFGKRTADA